MSPPPRYQGPERREAPISEDRVRFLIQESVTKGIEAQQSKMLAHMDDQFRQLRDTFSLAFPNGDASAHRLAHEQSMRQASWWSKIKDEAVSKTMTAGVWAFLFFAAVSIWEHIKSEARKG